VFRVGTADRAWAGPLSTPPIIDTGPDPGDMADWLIGTPGKLGGSG
jgi:hypothetical protein